ncbi:hypothetical protein H9P43_000240 [Blastocladiella emersonii ATCC 22665]|nr:hypothetical protein H9P43_000240 [Blastocladiella emersonii ATCC 22665]
MPKLPAALRVSGAPAAPTFPQQLLHGFVGDAMLERLLERLAAVFPESLPRFLESDPATGAAGAGAGAENSSHRDRIMSETAFMSVEYVWVPIVETPFGPERNEDVVWRLSAPLVSLNLNDPGNAWTITHLGRPEAPTESSKTVHRQVRQVPLRGSADGGARPTFEQCLEFLASLGYRPHYQYAKRGYAFICAGVATILVYKVYNLPPPTRTTRVGLHGVSPIEANHGMWVVELATLPPETPQVPPEALAKAEFDMMQVVEYLQGLVETHLMDPVTLRDQIPYRVR